MEMTNNLGRLELANSVPVRFNDLKTKASVKACAVLEATLNLVQVQIVYLTTSGQGLGT